MKNNISLLLMTTFYIYVNGCPPDSHSIGLVLNNGEYASYGKLESFGTDGKNYIKGYITDKSFSTVEDPGISSNFAAGNSGQLSATLISESFVYDPEITKDFTLKPMFSFKEDTLLINDYWALAEQPDFRCSLLVSNDTITISYLAAEGIVRDWIPTVWTTLKIKLSNPSPIVVFTFKGMNRFARDPQKTGYRDAGQNYSASVMVPPPVTYKFRARTFPYAMVYLSYELHSTQYKLCPRITITKDTTAVIPAIYLIPSLLELLINELQWLSNDAICIPDEKTMNRLKSFKKDRYSGAGAYFWTKQDSLIALNQWFTIESDSLKVLGVRDGCGINTDLVLPDENLSPPVTFITYKKPVSTNMEISVGNRMLKVFSKKLFDEIQIFNLLGKQIYSYKFNVPKMSVSLSLPHQQITKGGKYLLKVCENHHKVHCQMISF